MFSCQSDGVMSFSLNQSVVFQNFAFQNSDPMSVGPVALSGSSSVALIGTIASNVGTAFRNEDEQFFCCTCSKCFCYLLVAFLIFVQYLNFSASMRRLFLQTCSMAAFEA